MANKCMTCIHPRRLEIDRKLVSGANIAKMGRDYVISEESLRHHKVKHLTKQLVRNYELREILSGKNLIGVVEGLLESAQGILTKTENDPKKYHIALSAIREVRETVSFLFEVACKLREAQLAEQRPEEQEQQRKYHRLNVPELLQLRALLMKMEGKEPGKRTDLIKKKTGPKAGLLHPQSVDLEKRRRRRRKEPELSKVVRKIIEEKKSTGNEVIEEEKSTDNKVNEFDAMRDKLGMVNLPPPPRSKGWTEP